MKAITPIDLGRIDGILPHTGGVWRDVWFGNYRVVKRNKAGAPEDANQTEFDTYKKASTELKKFLAHTELSGDLLFQEKLHTDDAGMVKSIQNCFPKYYHQFSSIHGWDQLDHSLQYWYLWYPAWMVITYTKQQLVKNNFIDNILLQKQIQQGLIFLPDAGKVFQNIPVLFMSEFKPLLELDLYVLQDIHSGNIGYDDNYQLKIMDMGGGITHDFLKTTI